MHILIAPNAFKNSLSATAAATAIQKGLQQSNLYCTTKCFPIGDGGDGTAHLLLQKLNGTIVPATVYDPLRKKINASFGLIDNGQTAVIELADASGIRLLKQNELNPLQATTYGTGELIKAALDKGVQKIILGIGGSATVDGAAGILQALGIRFLDEHKNELIRLPEELIHLAAIDISRLDKRILNVELIILCDVTIPLLGNNGAAAIFGPQKGATKKDVVQLENALARFSEVTMKQAGKDMSAIKYGGAAGGTAAGLYAFLQAQLVSGIDYFLSITNFEEALQKTTIVITGEGSIDEQTLEGKGPMGVALQAKQKGIPVVGLAGAVPLKENKVVNNYFDVLLSINHASVTIEEAIQCTEENLIRTAKELGNILALKSCFSL